MTATKNTRSRVIVEEYDSSQNDENVSEASEAESNEPDVDESADNESGSDNEQKKRKNAGWADSMAKILKTNKPKGKKTIVLAKAKKLNEVVIKEKPQDPGFEVENEEIKEEKPDPEILAKEQDATNIRKKKKDIVNLRVKPSILERERERTLSKIATRGVVQLFNAVRAQQRDIDNRLKEAGPLERKQSQVLKSIDKRAFLDVLMGGERSKSQLVDGPVKNEPKSEVKNEKPTDSKWSVLRDDFMTESKLKDWDKEDSDEDNESSLENLSDLSDT